MAHTVKLETTDLEMPEYQRYLTRHGITTIKVADAERVLGAGDIIQYFCANRTSLVNLIREWFAPGKINADLAQEMIAEIKAVR